MTRETPAQRRRAAKKAKRNRRYPCWPEWQPEVPPETVCETCGFQAVVLFDPREEFATPCFLCGTMTARYAGGDDD